MNNTDPAPTLLDLARQAHEGQQAETQMTAELAAGDARYAQFQTGQRLLTRLLPAVLGVQADVERMEILQLHATGFTAQIEVEGYLFRPKETAWRGEGQVCLDERHVTALEVRIRATARLMRHSDIVWVEVKDLAGLGRALGIEAQQSWPVDWKHC